MITEIKLLKKEIIKLSFENAEYLLSEDKENNGRILIQMMRKTNDKSIYKQIYTKLLV